MSNTNKPRTWRELLHNILKSSFEKQRIAREMRINPVTLHRWAIGKSRPRVELLYALVQAIPDYRQQMIHLIVHEFPQFALATKVIQETPLEITSSFYTQVMKKFTSTPALYRSAHLRSFILHHLLTQLDPTHRALFEVQFALCFPPAGGNKVRSLRAIQIDATRSVDVESRVEQRAFFVGNESQLGYTVSSGRKTVVQSPDEKFHPFLHKLGVSAVAFPLLQSERVAGGIYLSSQRENYFTPERQMLIERYCHLLLLTCEPDQFYRLEAIKLGMMPALAVQQPLLDALQMKIVRLQFRSQQQGVPLRREQAEQSAWQELEEELLRAALEK